MSFIWEKYIAIGIETEARLAPKLLLPPFQKECPVSKYGHGLLHGSLIESRYNLTTLN